MTLSKTIALRKLTASILLGVWVLLHLVKGFHSHHLPERNFSQQVASVVTLQTADIVDQSNGSGTSDCSICDFHLTKNADHAIAEFAALHPSLIDTFFPDYYSSFVSAYSDHIKGRGPPSFA